MADSKEPVVAPAPEQAVDTTNESAVATDGPDVNQELLDLMSRQQQEIDTLKARAEAAETKADRLDAGNKRKREQAFKDTIGGWYEKMVDLYNQELGDDKDRVEAMFNRMKESDDSMPMVNLLSCTAAAAATSTAKLEQAYQESKRLKTERDSLQAQVARFQKPALDEARERFAPAPAAAPKPKPSSWTPVLPHGMKLPEQQRDGMQVRNPDFWQRLTQRGTSTTNGMSWFSEPTLVGKTYQAGRKPVSLAGRTAP